MLAIHKIVMQTLIDLEISHEEFKAIVDEKQRNEQMI